MYHAIPILRRIGYFYAKLIVPNPTGCPLGLTREEFDRSGYEVSKL